MLALLIMSIISSLLLSTNIFKSQDKRAAHSVANAMSRARVMGLVDNSYIANLDFANSYKLARTDKARLLSEYENFYWQIQFHLSGVYTFNSISIYRDTPRFANSTDFDKRPLAGDIIALNVSNSKCLSGYNNTNIADFCKNNASIFVRLNESMNLKEIKLLNNISCLKYNSFRFYFNNLGEVFCDFSKAKKEPITKILIGEYIINLVNATGYFYFKK